MTQGPRQTLLRPLPMLRATCPSSLTEFHHVPLGPYCLVPLAYLRPQPMDDSGPCGTPITMPTRAERQGTFHGSPRPARAPVLRWQCRPLGCCSPTQIRTKYSCGGPPWSTNATLMSLVSFHCSCMSSWYGTCMWRPAGEWQRCGNKDPAPNGLPPMSVPQSHRPWFGTEMNMGSRLPL